MNMSANRWTVPFLLSLLMLLLPWAATTDYTYPLIEEESLAETVDEQEAGARSINQLGWEWANKDMDAGYVHPRALTKDSSGASYVAGIFAGGSLAMGSDMVLNEGGYDIYLGKLNSDGDWLWGTSFGGDGDDFVEDIAVDSNGAISIVGSSNSTYLAAGWYNTTNSGGFDGFAARYKDSANGWQWLAATQGPGNENFTGVDHNSSGDLLISGWYDGGYMTLGSNNLTNSGGVDMILAEIDNFGWVDWVNSYGDTGNEYLHDIAWSNSGKFFAVGEFTSSSLQLDSTTISHGGGSGAESLVIRATSVGVEWARKPIYTADDRATHIAVDDIGNAIVGGQFMRSSNGMTWGSVYSSSCSNHGSRGFYVTKVSTAGTVGWAEWFCATSSSSSYHHDLRSLNVTGSTLMVGASGRYNMRMVGSNSYSSCSVDSTESGYVLRLSSSTGGWSSCFGLRDTPVWGAIWDSSQSKVTIVCERIGTYTSTNYNFNSITDVASTLIGNVSYNGGTTYWQTNLGGTGDDTIFGLDVSSSGVATVGGLMHSQSLRIGNHSLHGGDNYDGYSGAYFIARTDANGNWMSGGTAKAKKLWENNDNYGWQQGKMAVASNGTVYMIGVYDESIEFDSATLTDSGAYWQYSVFFAIWEPANGWTHYENIPLHFDTPIDIVIDANDDVFVSGYCSSYGYFNSITGGSGNRPCIAKMDNGGDWASVSRPGSNCYFGGLGANPSGGVVAGVWHGSGCYFGSEYVPYGGAIQMHSNGTWGTSWELSSSGYQYYEPRTVKVDTQGNVYIGGHFENSVTFDSNVGIQSGGNYDGFLVKGNSTGVWQWGITIGGSSTDEIIDTALLSNNTIGVVGKKSGTVSVGLNTLGSNGKAFVAVATSAGGWAWAVQLSNANSYGDDSHARAIDFSGAGTLMVAGDIAEESTLGLDQLTNSEGQDIFIAKMSADQDRDEVTDNRDNCPNVFNLNQADLDSDGSGDLCDNDDDGDTIADSSDSCPMGSVSWLSNSSTDHDGDGCEDSGEDTDDDEDGLTDTADSCPRGSLNWLSNSSTDHDGDGCLDSVEDHDDDSDSVTDSFDSCPLGMLGWTSHNGTDRDGDGCRDSDEDIDDDGDSILDTDDRCAAGEMGWSSTGMTDNDGDGCQDSSEDTNDDDDDYLDHEDHCAAGMVNWPSGSVSDWDSDGCRDADEDLDDDNDGVLDVDDQCPKSPLGWRTNPSVDFDQDGCHDMNEDWDDDGDGVSDLYDHCGLTAAGMSVDANGCSSEDISTIGGGGGGNTTIINNENHYHNNTTWVNNTFVNDSDEYNNNSFTNNTYSNETFANQTFTNNTYRNDTFENQSFTNNTFLNQTDDDKANDTDSGALDENLEASSETPEWQLYAFAGLGFLLLILIFTMIRRGGKGPDWRKEDELATAISSQNDSEFNDLMGESSGVVETGYHSGNTSEHPPQDMQGRKDEAGYEWVEWPAGSGINFYRPPGGTWARWQG